MMKQNKKYNLDATKALFADDKNSKKLIKVMKTLYSNNDIYNNFKKLCEEKMSSYQQR